MKPRHNPALAAGLLVLACSGCAVLEVNVDVYKGPLVNHEDIQARQVASIAMTARTLLVTMRNHFAREAGVCSQLANSARYEPDADLRRCLAVKEPSKLAAFTYIRQLNNVLGLYEDQDPAATGGDDFDISFASSRGFKGLSSLASELNAEETSPAELQANSRKPTYEQKRQGWVAREQLYRGLIDLAGRLSFLAVNIHLINPDAATEKDDTVPSGATPRHVKTDSDTERFKYTLEAVGNTLLVHADDLRHRMKHDERQLESGNVAREVDAAHSAFRQQRQAMVWLGRQLELELELAKARARIAKRLDDDIKALNARMAEAKKSMATLLTQHVQAATTEHQWAALLAFLQGGQGHCQKAMKALPVWSQNEKRELQALETSPAANDDVRACEALANQWHAKTKANLSKGPDNLAAVLKLAKDTLTEHQGKAASNSAVKTRLNDALQALEQLDATKPYPDALNAQAAPAALAAWAQLKRAAAQQAVDAKWANLKAQAQAERGLLAAQGRLTQQKDQQAKQPSESAVQLAIALAKAKGDAIQLALDSEGKGSDTASALARLKAQATDEQALAALGSLKPPPPQAQALSVPASAQEVLDTVIAQLRYLHLESVARLGKENPASQRLEQAIALAFKQRAGMAYLRPSSAYLRSVFVATANQDNPVVGWTNLLTKNPSHVFKRFLGADRVDEVRLALDKASWQNINTVRLTGGGDVNYAVAKDDVGNWYVKSMGADPGAMINAAKGLALYNLGARLPANLLRMDELRQRIDNPDTATADRERADTELTELRSQSGGRAHASSLELFEKRHNADAAALLAKLKSAFQADALPSALKGRWRQTYSDAERSGQVEELLAGEAFTAAMNTAAEQAGTDLTQAPGTTAAQATYGSLQALRQAAVVLRSRVLELPALVDKEAGQLKTARDDLPQRQADVNSAAKKVAEAQKQASLADQAVNDAAATKDEPKRESLRAQARLRAEELARALAEHGQALEKQQEAVAKVDTAVKAHQAAQVLRQRAAQDVDAVLGKLLADSLTERERQMAEFETAIKVLGQLKQ